MQKNTAEGLHVNTAEGTILSICGWLRCCEELSEANAASFLLSEHSERQGQDADRLRVTSSGADRAWPGVSSCSRQSLCMHSDLSS